jgi:hypothetical protein
MREGKFNDNNEGTITHSPECLQLIKDLRQARESDAAIAADLAQAKSVLAGLAAERGRLEGQLRASEEVLASSGALPDGPFAAEHGIQDVDRRIRVAKARVQLIGGKLADSRANINSLKSSLGGAFGQFVTTNLAEVRARYRTAALALRNIYCEQFPWLQAAQLAGVKVRYADVAVIADPEHIGDERVLLDSRDMARSDAAWQKVSGPLHVRLTALHAEVAAAIGEPKAPREEAPAKAAPPTTPARTSDCHSPDALAMVLEQTGFGRKS